MKKVICFAADHLFLCRKWVFCAQSCLWGKFVQEMGILCTKLLVWGKFVQEMGILCTKIMGGN